MKQITDGIIVLLGAKEEDVGDINRFRQKSSFMYLTGVESPNASLILCPEGIIGNKTPEEILFVPRRNPAKERWTGPQIGSGEEAQQAYGIGEVAPTEAFFERLFRILYAPLFKDKDKGQPTQPKVYVIIPHYMTAMVSRERELIDIILRAAPHVPVYPVQSHINDMRRIKSPAEVQILRKAIDITSEGMRAGWTRLKPGVYEYEVQAAIESVFTGNGAMRPGFSSIIGAGFNSTILHHNRNGKRIEDGDLVVMDIGAEHNYYTADLTRTFPASGIFTSRQREIYKLVIDAQRAAEQAFKPAKSTILDLERVVKEFFKASPLRDKEGNTLDRYFIHGVGHGLGMDVHDPVDLSKPMTAGTVFTIEPGLYIPDEKIGVRIEDDYLVTETDLVKLSSNLPYDPDEIERLMFGKDSPVSTKAPDKRKSHK